MAATLFFPDSRCTIPWYILKGIANIDLMKIISWVKVVRQLLIELLDNIWLNTFELHGC